MIQRYQAVIFDLDGVIVSTDRYHFLAWKRMADEIGIPFDETVNNRLRGIGRMDSLNIILEKSTRGYSADEKRDFADRKNTYYKQQLTALSPDDLSSQVRDCLDRIKRAGFLTAIGSSSKNAKLILRQLGLDSFFDAVSDGTNITRSKPDPEVFFKAAEYLSLPPALCLVVEDAKSGVEAALAGGMDCAAIGDATRYNIATYNLSRFSDLLSILSI